MFKFLRIEYSEFLNGYRQTTPQEKAGKISFRFKCTKCEKSFKLEASIKKHMMNDHVTDDTWLCDVCTYKNKTSSGTEITVSATLSPHKIVSYVNAKSSSDVVKVNGNIFIQNILIEEFYMNQEKMIIQEFLKSRANLVFAKLTETNVNDPIFIEKSKFFGLYRHGQYIHYKNGLTADFDYVFPEEGMVI